jgi:NhaA family Na+:H+ antiporter
VLALAGRSLPPTARIFLLGLAVVDDLGAIILIAVVFTGGVQLLALAAAAALCGLYAFLQHRRVRTPLVYVPIALATWVAVHEAGVHATIAGVALALLTRVRADPGEEEGPAIRLEHRLQPFSAGFCVPAFAFLAAGVPIGASALATMFAQPIAQAVIAGLLVGKLIGIFGASYLVVTLTPACRPRGLRWRDMLAVSMLGGVGFTVSLLMTELSLADAPPEVLNATKASVLVASAAAAVLASVVLVRRSRAHERKRAGNSYGEDHAGA